MSGVLSLAPLTWRGVASHQDGPRENAPLSSESVFIDRNGLLGYRAELNTAPLSHPSRPGLLQRTRVITEARRCGGARCGPTPKVLQLQTDRF